MEENLPAEIDLLDKLEEELKAKEAYIKQITGEKSLLEKSNKMLKLQRIIMLVLLIVLVVSIILIRDSLNKTISANYENLMQNYTLNDELASSKDSIDELTATITNNESHIAKLEEQLDVFQMDTDKQADMILEYKYNIEWLQNKIDSYEQENASLKEDVAEYIKKINEKDKTINEKDKTISEKDKTISELRSERSAIRLQ